MVERIFGVDLTAQLLRLGPVLALPLRLSEKLHGQLLEALGGVNSMCEKLEDAVLQSAKDYADDIYQALEKEYDYISSDEYLMELCESNDYRFNDDGHLV